MNRPSSGLLSTLVLATAVSVSQGQVTAVDSLDASIVFDSARVGSLTYRAATTLTYPKRDPNKPGDIVGDLTTTLTIANTGAQPAEIRLTRCPVRVYAFLRADYKPLPRLNGFHNTLSCMASDRHITIAPAEVGRVTVISRNWKHGDAAWLGPMHFVSELQLPDTSIRLSAGKSAVTSSLEAIDYHGTTTLEGTAPAKVVSTVTISNHGELPVELRYGACSVGLFAFTTPARTGKPAWDNNPDGVCILVLYGSLVAPGHSLTRVVSVPNHEMRKDPIPAGRYFFKTEFKVNDQKLVMDAGELTLRGYEDPLPSSRSVDSIQFSSSVKRVVGSQGSPDSLEVMFIARNSSHSIRQVRPEGRTGCVGILGYKTRERRDAYYSRPAYESDWILRPCPMPIIPFDLAPADRRVFVKRMPAPTESMYYVVYLSFFDDAFPARESYLVDVSADEN